MRAKLSVAVAMATLVTLTAACGGHEGAAPVEYGTVVGTYTGGPGGDAMGISEAITLIPTGTISLTGEGRAYSVTVTDGLFKLKVLPGRYTISGVATTVRGFHYLCGTATVDVRANTTTSVEVSCITG